MTDVACPAERPNEYVAMAMHFVQPDDNPEQTCTCCRLE